MGIRIAPTRAPSAIYSILLDPKTAPNLFLVISSP